jgi:hypothetical protein
MALLEIPGLDKIKISRDGGGFAFKVFVSEETDQEKYLEALRAFQSVLLSRRRVYLVLQIKPYKKQKQPETRLSASFLKWA